MDQNASIVIATPSPYVPNITTVQSVMAIVEMAYKSGMVKVKNIDDARFIALYGLELSIPVMTSLRCIYSVNGGAPTCSGELLLALIRRSGKVSIKISSTEETLKANRATVYMKRLDSGDDFTAAWGKSDDDRAQLRSNRDKYPAQMWTWRAVSICAKALCSDIVGGMYTIEEIYPDAKLDESGDIVGDVTITRESAPPTPATAQIPATTPITVEPAPADPAPVVTVPKEATAYTLPSLYNAVLKDVYNNVPSHMKASIDGLIKDGKITADMTLEKAIAAVKDRKTTDNLPVSQPPQVAASNLIFDGVTPPAEPEQKYIPTDAELRRATLARLEGEAVTLCYARKAKYVKGQGMQQGWKWVADAQILESDDSTPKVEVKLFPEDIDAIRLAGWDFPQSEAPIHVPVNLHIEADMIRIDRETIERKQGANPFGGKPVTESDVMFKDIGISDAAKHQLAGEPQ